MATATGYSFALQGLGMVVVVGVSILGVMLPAVMPERPATRAAQLGVLGLKGCAVGILLATAVVHLIAESQEYMEDLGWLENYSALPVAIALCGILLMAGFDLIPGGHSHGGHANGHGAPEERSSSSHSRQDDVKLQIPDERALLLEPFRGPKTMIQVPSKPSGYGSGNQRPTAGSPELADQKCGDQAACCRSAEHPKVGLGIDRDEVCEGNDATVGGNGTIRASTVILMEASVLTHSLLVGYTLGLLPVGEWAMLVVAITFHQFFEGLALGEAMRGVNFSSTRRLYVALAFSLITGFGIALGMATIAATGDSTPTPTIKAVVAVLEAFCGGILTYIAFSLWMGWFVHSNECVSAAGRTVSFVGLSIGIAIMVVIGMWA